MDLAVGGRRPARRVDARAARVDEEHADGAVVASARGHERRASATCAAGTDSFSPSRRQPSPVARRPRPAARSTSLTPASASAAVRNDVAGDDAGQPRGRAARRCRTRRSAARRARRSPSTAPARPRGPAARAAGTARRPRGRCRRRPPAARCRAGRRRRAPATVAVDPLLGRLDLLDPLDRHRALEDLLGQVADRDLLLRSVKSIAMPPAPGGTREG